MVHKAFLSAEWMAEIRAHLRETLYVRAQMVSVKSSMVSQDVKLSFVHPPSTYSIFVILKRAHATRQFGWLNNPPPLIIIHFKIILMRFLLNVRCVMSYTISWKTSLLFIMRQPIWLPIKCGETMVVCLQEHHICYLLFSVSSTKGRYIISKAFLLGV